jgi:hypothetical protein
MGIAEGWKSWKKGKRTRLRQNQVEELHEGPMSHIGTKEQRDRMTINKKVQFLNVKTWYYLVTTGLNMANVVSPSLSLVLFHYGT